MNDKNKVVNATLELVNDKLHFSGLVEGNEPVSIDYIPPLGDNLGYTSLELLLLSLSSCLGSACLTFLRRMNKKIEAFTIESEGLRKQEHPTVFSKIKLTIKLVSPDITEPDLMAVIKMAEDKYCPVWAMLKGNVEIEAATQITAPKLQTPSLQEAK